MENKQKPPQNSLEIYTTLIQSFFDNAPIAIIIYEVLNKGLTSKDYIIKHVNPASLKIEKWTRTNVIGKPLYDVRPGVDEFGLIDIFKKVWDTGVTIHYPAKVYNENEEQRWFENTIFKLPTGEVVAIYSDVTEAKIKEEKIKFLSLRDSLTGLYNRTFFKEELKRLDIKDQLPLTLIMGDLDGLKLINEIFGHQIGDEVLIKIAEVFKDSCRETDIISRWGGDEFIALLPKTSEQTGQEICDKIKEACSNLTVEDTKLTVEDTTLSISMGYASKTNINEEWQDVLKKTEDNMYRSKLLGAQSYRNTILVSMTNALFEKSCETEEHGERLGHYCREIGHMMGLSPCINDELELFAMLHDIGKIAIEDSILEKPGPLTDEEWLIMKTHPEIGFRIAQTVPELINIAEYILSHHERWDGKGYPRGLTGEEIPLLARILAVVDSYDAMTQDRPYRKALSSEVARAELLKNAGTQYDPKIVDIFITYLNQNKETDQLT